MSYICFSMVLIEFIADIAISYVLELQKKNQIPLKSVLLLWTNEEEDGSKLVMHDNMIYHPHKSFNWWIRYTVKIIWKLKFSNGKSWV